MTQDSLLATQTQPTPQFTITQCLALHDVGLMADGDAFMEEDLYSRESATGNLLICVCATWGSVPSGAQ